MTTKTNETQPSLLTDRQLLAIEELLKGATHQEAAETVGVHRCTITDWCNHNVGFITELNQRRYYRLRTAGEKLNNTLGAALDLLTERINQGDINTAITLLKTVGVKHLLDAATPGPTTPLSVHHQLATQISNDLTTELFIDSTASWLVDTNSEKSFD